MFNPNSIVAAGIKDDFQVLEQHQPEDGIFVDVVLVDVSAELMGHSSPFDPVAHPLDIVHAFHVENPVWQAI